MRRVSSQIRRAINEAINEQVLPQIQATLRSGQGQVPDRRWEVTAKRPEHKSEEALNRNFRSSSREELPRDLNRNHDLENTHYNCTMSLFPEMFLTGLLFLIAIGKSFLRA